MTDKHIRNGKRITKVGRIYSEQELSTVKKARSNSYQSRNTGTFKFYLLRWMTGAIASIYLNRHKGTQQVTPKHRN